MTFAVVKNYVPAITNFPLTYNTEPFSLKVNAKNVWDTTISSPVLKIKFDSNMARLIPNFNTNGIYTATITADL